LPARREADSHKNDERSRKSVKFASSTTGSRSDRPRTTFHIRQVPRHIRTPDLRSHTGLPHIRNSGLLLGGLLLLGVLLGGLLLLGVLLGGMCAAEPAG